MRLNEGYYDTRDLAVKEGQLETKIRFNPAHPLFAGHFPGRPVVPGVCVFEIIREVLREATGMQASVQSIASVKYMRPLLPDGLFSHSLHLSWDPASGQQLSTDADIRSGDTVCVKIRGFMCNMIRS